MLLRLRGWGGARRVADQSVGLGRQRQGSESHRCRRNQLRVMVDRSCSECITINDSVNGEDVPRPCTTKNQDGDNADKYPKVLSVHVANPSQLAALVLRRATNADPIVPPGDDR